MKIRVTCHAGYKGEETPRSFSFGDREIQAAEVLDMWLAPDHRYFKVQDGEGSVYILRHDPHLGEWELAFFKTRDCPAGR